MMNFGEMSMSLFLVGVLGFLMFNKHIMTMLLMMEFMMLSLVMMLGVSLHMFYTNWMILLVMFILVCESVLGISCIVLLSRSHKGEYMESLKLIKC